METITTQIAYLGSALDDGLMPVSDLAPALLGVGELVQHANRRLNGDTSKVEVRVHSNFERGSFIVTISFLQSPIQTLVQTLTSPNVSALTNLLGILGFVFSTTGMSLFGIIKYLKGKRVEPTPGKTTRIEVVVEGKLEVVVVDNTLLELYNDNLVRTAARQILEPVHKEGYSEFQTRQNEKTVESVTTDEVGYFDAIPAQEPELSQDREVTLDVVKPSFRRHLTWGLAEGENSFSAAIEDRKFWDDVDQRTDLFGAGDRLKVILREEVAKKAEGGFRVQRTVLQVLEIVQPPKVVQQTLFPAQPTESQPRPNGPAPAKEPPGRVN